MFEIGLFAVLILPALIIYVFHRISRRRFKRRMAQLRAALRR